MGNYIRQGSAIKNSLIRSVSSYQTRTYQFASVILLFLTLLFSSSTTFSQSPVSINGALKVSGNKILNNNNQVVSFAGASFFWSNKNYGAERFYNAGTVNYFKNTWKAGITRAAMGVDADNGYIQLPAENKARVKAVVDAAIAAGVYVIIDWHSHNAEDYKAEAIAFFKEMAQTYGSYPNVLYEVYNEPDFKGTTSIFTTWPEIKAYAEDVIREIRAYDPDNIIIVGTPVWSQNVDEAASNRITMSSNIAYTLHFYAATHKEELRARAQTALNAGIALFVTEWGTVTASGDGGMDVGSTDQWMAFLKANNISSCNWSIGDKQETASILKFGISSDASTWTDADLTPSGLKVKDIVFNWNLPGVSPVVALTAPTHGGTFTAPASIVISATASDSDGTVSNVSFYNGTTLLNTDNTSPYSYTWTNVPVGTYNITAKATDNAGRSATSTASTVSVNTTPNLAANKPVVVSSTENSSFPGSMAVDGDLNTRWSSAYADPQWLHVDLGSNVTVNRVKVSWQFAAGKDYLVQISSNASTWTTLKTITGNTVYDNDHTGLSGTGRYVRIYGTARATIYGYSIFELEVYGAASGNLSPAVSLTSPANGASFTAPANITINAAASDSDGTISLVEFFNGSTLLGSDNTSPYSYTWTSVAAGNYSITARAKDNAGATTTSNANSVIVVTSSNVSPTVSLTAPANGSNFTAPASITMNATASDSDGTISLVEFFNGSTLLGSDNTSPYSYTWTSVAAGNYSITARATDNAGATTTSGVNSVTVTSPSSGGNILSNASFESGTTSWIGSACTLAQDATQKQAGNYSLKITGRSNQWAGPVQNIKTALIFAGTGSYNFSGWARKESGTGVVKVAIMLKYGGVSYFYGASATVTSTGWTQISGTQNLSWTGTLEDATFYVETLNSDADNFYLDNCLLAKPGSGASYTITASAGTGGTISPNGSVSVASGTSSTFTIAASSNYQIAGVVVDGASVGAVTSYTFTNVTAAHTISATFSQTTSNLLSNGSFESGTTSWAGSGSTITQSATQQQSGSYSLKVSARSNQWSGPVQNIKTVLISSGTGTYNYSAWIRKESGTATAKVSIMLKYGGVSHFFGAALAVNNTGWTQISGSQSLTWSGTLEDATFYIETINSDASDFFADNCSLVKSASSSGRIKTQEVSVSESSDDSPGVESFPNPVNDVLNIRLTGNWGGEANIELMNVSGVNVTSGKLNGMTYSLDVANLPSGLYVLKVFNSSRRQVTKIYKR